MINLENTYAELPQAFHRLIASPNKWKPTLLAFNHDLARELGLDFNFSDQILANFFSAAEFMPGSIPVAMGYAGHQFGHFVPQLGDGRAMLLGEFIAKDQHRYDIHLKGSGRTYYSRGGDGKSAIGPVIREYIVSEGMHALKIPTTRTLCAVRTNESVQREEILPGAVLTRIAKAHIRVGSFQYFAYQGDLENLKILADYTITRLYPGLSYLEFWKTVANKQISLISQWMSVGFIHGVMNTDNMSVAGESIDFGPCAFMDEFKIDKVFSSIDQNGRYAYSNQPHIALWNLARLAECMIPLIGGKPEEAQKLLESELKNFQNQMMTEYLKAMVKKFGLKELRETDDQLVRGWYEFLQGNDLDFTMSYIDLERKLEGKKTFFDLEDKEGFEIFFKSYQERLSQDGRSINEVISQMQSTNPMTIPRNHLVDRAIRASEKGDDKPFFELVENVKKPFARVELLTEYQTPPKPAERIQKTFCGT